MMNFISNTATTITATSTNNLPSVYVPTCKPPVSREGVVYRQKQLTRPSAIEFSLIAIVSQANKMNMESLMLSFEQLSHVSKELFGFELGDAKNPSASKRESKISSRIKRWEEDKMEGQSCLIIYDNAMEIDVKQFAIEYPVVLPFNGLLFNILDSILVQPNKSLIKDIRKENVEKGFVNKTPVKPCTFNARVSFADSHKTIKTAQKACKKLVKTIKDMEFDKAGKQIIAKAPAKVIKKTTKKQSNVLIQGHGVLSPTPCPHSLHKGFKQSIRSITMEIELTEQDIIEAIAILNMYASNSDSMEIAS